MEIQRHNGTLSITDVRELSATNARSFRNEISAVLTSAVESIEIDLSQTRFVDSSGLGALMLIYHAANERQRDGSVTIRLLNPLPPVQQMFELTRMHRLFEIVSQNGQPDDELPANPSANEIHPSAFHIH